MAESKNWVVSRIAFPAPFSSDYLEILPYGLRLCNGQGGRARSVRNVGTAASNARVKAC